MLIAILLTFILIFMVIYERKTRNFITLQKEQELLKQKEVFEAINSGEDKERVRIAQDLHDGIGAKLSGIKMQLEFAMNKQLYQGELMDNLVNELDEAILEVREISHNLQPNVLNVKGLNKSLTDFISHLNKKGNCKFESYFDLKEYVPSLSIQVCLHRIGNELLVNILKHAKAKTASIQVQVMENQLLVICEDDGVGFNNKDVTTKGIGLQNIANRLKQLNGKINIDSSLKGTTIVIEIPINYEA